MGLFSTFNSQQTGMKPKAELPQTFSGANYTPLTQNQLFQVPENTWKTPGAVSSGNNPWDAVYNRTEDGNGLSNITSVPRWLFNLNPIQDLVVTDGGGNFPMGFSTKGPDGNQDWFYSGTKMGQTGVHPDDYQASASFDPTSWRRTKNTPLLREAQRTGNWALLNGTPYDTLGPSGEVTGQKLFEGLGQEDNMDQLVGFAAAALATAGAAGWLGGGGGAAQGAGAGAFDTAGFEGIGSQFGLTEAGAAGAGGIAGVPPPANPFSLSSYLNPTNLMNAIKSPMGIEKLFSNPLTRNIATKTLGGMVSGGMGGSGSSSGQSGGFGMNTDLMSLLGLGASAYGAKEQLDSSKHMLDWLNGQQAKIDNLYSPGSNEFNSLFDQMSRQDAAAGRNSQYGPRSVDLASRIAEIKAKNTANLTTGIGNTYAAALNRRADTFAGIPGLLNYMGQRGGSSGGGGNSTLGGIADFFMNRNPSTGVGYDIIPQTMPFGDSMSNDAIWDMINGGSGGGGFDFGGFADIGSFF